VLPDAVEALTGAELTSEMEDEIQGDDRETFQQALLFFAGGRWPASPRPARQREMGSRVASLAQAAQPDGRSWADRLSVLANAASYTGVRGVESIPGKPEPLASHRGIDANPDTTNRPPCRRAVPIASISAACASGDQDNNPVRSTRMSGLGRET
jgi:hypothetical protein